MDAGRDRTAGRRRSRRTWLTALLSKDNVCNEVHCECEFAAWVEGKREEVEHLLAGEHWGGGTVCRKVCSMAGGGEEKEAKEDGEENFWFQVRTIFD